MATVAPGDVLRLTAKQSYIVGDVQNVYHFKHDGDSSLDSAPVVAGLRTFIDDAYAELNAVTADGLFYDTINIFNLTQDEPLGEYSWPTLTQGAESATDAYTTQAAALVKFLTEVARSQGRKYIAGLVEGQVSTGGVISTALQTALGNFATELFTFPIVGGQEFILGNYNAALARFAEWSSAVIADRLATQRRRRAGTGS